MDENEAPVEQVQVTEQFFYDEFFADDNGVEVWLPIRGRSVPIRIKRGLTLREKTQAQAVAIKRRVDPATGRVIIEDINEAAGAEAVILASIVSWPFVHRDGSPVPITKETVNKLLGGLDILGNLLARMEAEGDAALAPFVHPSAGA